MTGKRIVILGAGFGGITAALELRRRLDDAHRIVVIDRSPVFMMGLRKLWVVAGRATRADGERKIALLARAGIEVQQAEVTRIDPTSRTVQTDAGTHAFDYLIIALGAHPRPDLVPGWSEAAFNLYDDDDAERLASRVRAFRGGSVVVAILGVPYKCPPAPYEAAMLLDDLFRARGIRAQVEMHCYTPQPMSLPVVGAANCAQVEGLLALKQIAFHPNQKIAALEGSALITDGGARVEAELLIGVPPHRPPEVVRDSSLARAGEWLAVEPRTLRTSVDGIFAIGDVVEITLANKMALPKAGVFAEAQGTVVASAIAAELAGRSPQDTFDGRGYCFIETGGGQATAVEGNFLAHPAPDVRIAPPSAEAYAQKVEFERSRLLRWFSSPS